MSISNLVTHPPHLPLVAPSILSADFANLEQECRRVIEAGGDMLHIDIMDGHFVPNLTMGPALCQSLRKALPEVFFDVHLMVANPGMFIKPFAEAGANNFTFHIEAAPEPLALVQEIHEAGMTAGLAINPPTEVEKILPFIEAFDMILVMSINPGFSGQAFMPEVLDRVKLIKSRLRADQRLAMDGGVNSQSVESCREAGCDLIGAASAIFKAPDYAEAIAMLRGPACVTARSE